MINAYTKLFANVLVEESLVENNVEAMRSIQVLKSQKPTCFSYHLIINVVHNDKTYLFSNATSVGRWLHNFKDILQNKIIHRQSFGSVTVEELRLIFSKASLNRKSHNLSVDWFIDETVYKRQQLFRTMYSSKINRPTDPFLLLDPQYTTHQNLSQQHLLNSLITSTHNTRNFQQCMMSVILSCRYDMQIADAVAVINDSVHEFDEGTFEKNEASTSSAVTHDTNDILSAEMKERIDLILKTLARLHSVQTNVFSWRTFKGHEYVRVYSSEKLRCPQAERVHRNNRVYFNASLRKNIIWVRCHKCAINKIL